MSTPRTSAIAGAMATFAGPPWSSSTTILARASTSPRRFTSNPSTSRAGRSGGHSSASHVTTPSSPGNCAGSRWTSTRRTNAPNRAVGSGAAAAAAAADPERDSSASARVRRRPWTCRVQLAGSSAAGLNVLYTYMRTTLGSRSTRVIVSFASAFLRASAASARRSKAASFVKSAEAGRRAGGLGSARRASCCALRLPRPRPRPPPGGALIAGAETGRGEPARASASGSVRGADPGARAVGSSATTL